jgi:peptidoglycan biosynthesis protein MviN/MurJ (putative lipid II flippase)
VILVLHSRLGYRAVALGTSLGSLVNAMVLIAAFEGQVGGLRGQGLIGRVGRMAAAAAVMGPAAWAAGVAIERFVGTQGIVAQAVTGLVPVAAGAALYLGGALLLGIPEARTLLAVVRRRKD